nr:PLP-dependent aminotransferase family protein [uncultured Duganella sp.]
MSQSKSIQDESQTIAWIGHFVHQAGPRYLQIADFIEQALSDGTLKPGDRLPPQRRLAALLKVDLTTVTRAYDEARRRHLLEGKGARGTYAAAPKVELQAVLDLSMNIPPAPANVDFDDMLKQGLAQVLLRTDSSMLMNYHLGGGSNADRAAGAKWLAPLFGQLNAEHIAVCAGAQSALAALILALSRPHDVILAEPNVYPGLMTAAQQLERRVVAVDIDASGMRPDLLDQACAAHPVALIYLNPTLQNPTTHTMPSARREEILRVAARHNVRIIEDDPYSLLAINAPPPLALLSPSQVVHIATLSKCLAPGLRTAYVLLPEALLRERFMNALRSFELMAAPLTTALSTQWIHDGAAQALLTGVRLEAKQRQRMAHQLLAGKAEPREDGIHLWLELPGYWTAPELARAAQAEGLAVTSSEVFSTGPRPPHAIRISLGAIQDGNRLSAALRKLSRLLSRRPDGSANFVV